MRKEKAQQKSHFAGTEAYDQRIRRFVPYYEEMMNAVPGCLPKQQNSPAVLESVCGTGNLSQKLLNNSGDCKLAAVYLVKEMVERLRERESLNIQIKLKSFVWT